MSLPFQHRFRTNKYTTDMTSSSIWHNASKHSHPSIRSLQTRQEVTTHEPEGQPNFSQMQPGESVSFDLHTPPPTERWTNDDRIEFKNGGSIQDKEGESGLLITSPEGETFEALGWIDLHTENGPTVNFRTKDQWDDYVDWEQTFPSEGGTVITQEAYSQEPDIILTVGADGTVSGTDDEIIPTDVPAQRQGPAIVFNEPWGPPNTAVSPPVPLDWIVS